MVIHDVKHAVNVYGDSALVNGDVSLPLTTPGNSPDEPAAYDYWDHVDYIIDMAEKKGLYMALVPVWGSNVRGGLVSSAQAEKYAKWLAGRFRDKTNIIWLNGGDVKGSDSTVVWEIIGSTIKKANPGQLMTYHPFGRTKSSTWFHNAEWLDFNMFQSGHRRYDQDVDGLRYGEDNWRYVADDYAKKPVKPTLDGEPSYEGIPQGLHDSSQPFWTAGDVRRYAYWSVFAGGCGFSYGHNAIMQFHKKGDTSPAYGVREIWEEALDSPGASQINYLKQLILSRPNFERVPAQELIAGENGEKYDYIVATRGKDYAFIYIYTGRSFDLDLTKLLWKKTRASWYSPRNGQSIPMESFAAKGIKSFDPPAEKADGNDWVLVLDKKQ
jgi:hypothetical protein